mgnify:CR=1 FL=1
MIDEPEIDTSLGLLSHEEFVHDVIYTFIVKKDIKTILKLTKLHKKPHKIFEYDTTHELLLKMVSDDSNLEFVKQLVDNKLVDIHFDS